MGRCFGIVCSTSPRRSSSTMGFLPGNDKNRTKRNNELTRAVSSLDGVVKLVEGDIQIQLFLIGIKGGAPGLLAADVGGGGSAVLSLGTLGLLGVEIFDHIQGSVQLFPAGGSGMA